MRYHIPRIMLAAPASGCGKTTITCGLLQTLLDRGRSPAAFKCGPDYIDPMFHKYVLGVDGGNLDSFFLSEPDVRSQLAQGAGQRDIAVIEGVMGYFDGVAGVSTWASSCDIARITETPVILIVDGKGASLSIAAMIQGFLHYGNGQEKNHIKGVLLNRISEAMADRIKPEIERLGVPVMGHLPECAGMKLESRHLGLVRPEELETLHQQLEMLAAQMKKTVDIDKICELAQTAPDIELGDEIIPYRDNIFLDGNKMRPVTADGRKQKHEPSLRIAVARDHAFCFYYQENLRLLEAMGAELIPFSPIKDSELPQNISGIILGGGYPELYGSELSSNTGMITWIKTTMEAGMPYLAECGGFLYLHEELEASGGTCYPMAGVIKGKGYPTGRLSRFGYISLRSENVDKCLRGDIKGHEFHYWDSTACGEDWKASKPLSSRGWSCVHSSGYQIAGFPHLYYPSNPEFLKRWLEGCSKYHSLQKDGREIVKD